MVKVPALAKVARVPPRFAEMAPSKLVVKVPVDLLVMVEAPPV